MPQTSDRRSKETIQALRMENRTLKRQIRMLKNERDAALAFGTVPHTKADRSHALLKGQLKAERTFSQKRYSAYIWDLIRHTSAFRIYSLIVRVVRKYSFIRITFKILLAVWAALQSGAIFLVSASFFIVLLPFSVLLAQITLLVMLFFAKRVNRKNLERLKYHSITIFFPADKAAFSSKSFFYGMTRAEAERENRFCIVVSPYYWKSIGINGEKRKPYIASRLEDENILLVRRHYYFSLKKKVLLLPSAHITMTEIY